MEGRVEEVHSGRVFHGQDWEGEHSERHWVGRDCAQTTGEMNQLKGLQGGCQVEVNEVTLGDSVLRREEEGPEGLIIQKTLNFEVGDLVKVV